MAVTAVVYLRSLANGFVLDDVPMLVNNPRLGDWSFLWKAFTREEFWYSDADFLPHFRNYRPLLLVWYWIDYHLFGLNPAPWHASAVIVHLLAVWLVYKISRHLAGDSTSALVAASVFGLIPVHVAAVAWMAASGFVLATAFLLGAFYLIIRRAECSARDWTAAIALYACALLSHESAAAFPALVACYAFLFVETPRAALWMRARRAVIWSAPFAAEFLLYLAIRRLVLGFYVSNPYDYTNLLTNAQAVLTVPLVLGTYLTLLAMPWLTLPNHSVFPVSSPLSQNFWLPLVAITLIVAAFLALVLRSPRRRFYLFCAAWVGITLTPMLLLHSVYHLVQDYYLYLPSVGSSLLLGDFVAVAVRKNALARRLAVGGAFAILVVYAITLWRVQRYWHDDVAAARGYVEGCPESTAWHTTLATYLAERGDLAQAENEVRTALHLEPDRTGTIHPDPRRLHRILGELMARRGDIDGAVLEFEKSLNDSPDEDEDHSSLVPRAFIREAISLYDQGLRDAGRGRLDQAVEKVTEALAMMKRYPVPDFGLPAMRYAKLAELYDLEGNHQQAESILKQVDSMPVGELAVGLTRASIRMNHSDKEGAERILSELLHRYPGNPEVLFKLGDVQADLKNNDQALVSYRRASEHWIGDPHLHLATAESLHALGREREALDQCRLALALAPHDPFVEYHCADIRMAVENKRPN